MLGLAAANSRPLWMSLPSSSTSCVSDPRIRLPRKFSAPRAPQIKSLSLFSARISHFALHSDSRAQSHFIFRASFSSSASVGSAECTEEPATKVKFQPSLRLPGCSTTLSLIGTGFREKVFAIVGVKVYAAGFYADLSFVKEVEVPKGRSAGEIQEDSSLFSSILQCNGHISNLSWLINSSRETSLQIVLVRDVDGKTFWDALDDAISPRIKAPTPVDDSALSSFRSIFEGRPIKKGTFIFLTWLDPSKMLVSISTDGLPSGVDATIESGNVTSALFDVFFGETPVSPSLKTSVVNGLATILNR